MLSSLVQWLDSVGWAVFWTCLTGLVALNGARAPPPDPLLPV